MQYPGINISKVKKPNTAKKKFKHTRETALMNDFEEIW